jgi:hypothetical protein
VLTVDHHARGDGDHDGDDHHRTEVWAGDGNSTVKVIDYKTERSCIRSRPAE